MSDELNSIYLFGYSPRAGIQVNNLILLAKNQVSKGLKLGIVLIHDGVISASSKIKTPEVINELMNLPIKIYAMIPDLKARGILLDNIKDDIKPIEYAELVDIIDSTEKIISWM
jgi:sulfur relay protein TusB/DsrH